MSKNPKSPAREPTPVSSSGSIASTLSLDSILAEADAHFAKGDCGAARDCLKQAVAIAPQTPALFGALGGLHFQLKEYAEAVGAFTAATERNPNDPDLQIKLAVSLVQLNQPTAAETALQRALELRADDPTALKLLADCHRDQGRHQDAALIYGKLLGHHPDQIAILLSLAKCFFALGDREGTQAALDEVLKIDPNNGMARENRAMLGRRTTQPSLAGRVRVVDTIDELKQHYGLQRDGVLAEEDLDVVDTDCDLHERKRRDAEVLCTLAANATGDVLELGTSHGRGAFKLATNLAAGLRCHTVNILPEQHDASGGKMVTHLIPKEDIGSYYRERGVKNVEQYFANTARWDIPAPIRNLSMIFVDAAHDEENVYLDSKLVWDRLAPGGFIVWHDFSPFSRTFGWIDASMRGVERFRREYGLEDLEVVNLRHSWCGVLRKPAPASQPTRVQENDRTSWTASAHSTSEPQPLVSPPLASANPPPATLRDLRYAIVYPSYSFSRDAEEAGLAARLSSLGYNVRAFGIPCVGGWWPFPKLDQKWRSRSADLMSRYGELADKLRDVDVLIAAGGSMLHPEFLRQLSTFNVFVCADDPESSVVLSRPVAAAFDFCCVTNIACVGDYAGWGVRHAAWLPLPIAGDVLDPTITEERILTGARDLDIVMLCERVYNMSDRAQRIERLVGAFPNAYVRGPGWPGGPVKAPPVYRRARIGWNLHNSSGPCNSRTTMLPAFGVLQICDNKSNLGKIFALDREVVGFDSVEECIDKTHYYLAHDEERRQITLAGWKRALADYTEDKWWNRLLNYIAPHLPRKRIGQRARPPHPISNPL